jgi:hypothetical protein
VFSLSWTHAYLKPRSAAGALIDGGVCALCNVQAATWSMQHATSNVQHATYTHATRGNAERLQLNARVSRSV